MSTTVTVTDRAYGRVAEILKSEPDKRALRVAVLGGGCSGFQYEFDLVAQPNADDIVMTKDGATVLVDELSAQYLAGSEIDFIDSLMGAKFEIRNPNATSTCGCGTSFSL